MTCQPMVKTALHRSKSGFCIRHHIGAGHRWNKERSVMLLHAVLMPLGNCKQPEVRAVRGGRQHDREENRSTARS